MTRFRKTGLMFMLLVFLPFCVMAAGYDHLVSFGDSLTDSGNILAASPDSYDSSSYYEGRFSNGPVWAEYLKDRLGINNTYLLENLFTGPWNPPSGYTWFNNAYGGSETGFEQLPPGLLTQIGLWVATPLPIPDNSLCTVWIGGNDFLNWMDGHTISDDATETVAIAVTNIIAGLEMLVSIQATDILVVNLPDLGETPANNGSYGEDASVFGTAVSVAFNTALKSALDEFETANPGVNIFFLDIFSVMHKMLEMPEAFDLLNTTQGALYETAAVDGFDNTGKYLFWDGIHPTTEAHKLVADQAYGVLTMDTDDSGVIFFETANTDMDLVGVACPQGNVSLSAYAAGSGDDTTSSAGKPDNFTYGICELSANVGMNDQAVITIYLPEPAPAGAKWYKYYQDEWIDFDRAVLNDLNGDGAVFNGARTQITLYVSDNGIYDDDLTVGVVHDPSGLGSNTASSEGGGGGCFIGSVGNISFDIGPLSIFGITCSLVLLVVLKNRKEVRLPSRLPFLFPFAE